jgi:hypothetical protein
MALDATGGEDPGGPPYAVHKAASVAHSDMGGTADDVARCRVDGRHRCRSSIRRLTMGRGLLLWLIGIPLPIILLIWLFGGLS